jgi:hydrogenase expression/formation protein HypE
MIVARAVAEQVLEILRAHPLGRVAAIIGEVVAEHPSKVGCAAGSAASA